MVENIENNSISKVAEMRQCLEFVNLPSLDIAAFQELRETICDDMIFSDLVIIYSNSAKKLINAIQLALANQDAVEFTITSHSLKSTSASIGAVRLSNICKHLEQAGRRGEISVSEGLVNLLSNEYTAAIAAIQTCMLEFMPE